MRNLQECHMDLQVVCQQAIKFYDFSVIEGYRGELTQERYYRNGTSQLRYPNSKHNQHPSLAVDLAPWPTLYSDKDQMFLLAGIFLSTANSMGVKIRWGGDWDGDWEMTDQKFVDLHHFELLQS